YYPQAYQNMKMEEFLQLEQGSMTVLEYEKKFNELSNQMMVRARGEPRRRQYETGGPSQGSSKRGSYSSGSSSGRSFRSFRPGISSSGGSNQSGSSGGRPTSSSARGSGRQPPSTAGRMRSPQCTVCGRFHTGTCRQGTTGCFHCGQQGHFLRECPLLLPGGGTTVAPPRETGTQSSSQQQGRGRRARATGRVYHMSQQQAQASPDVVTGTLSVFGTPARILIDPGATHSFVTPSFADNADVKLSALRSELAISVPTGEIFYVGTVYRDSPVLMGDICLEADLIPLEMMGLDVILGMDWLAKHHASVDCFRKEVVLRSPGRPEVTFY
ncbi:PREDICTED: zf-CCHC domain-containing /RVP_2, partial [Prunus dulcis]